MTEKELKKEERRLTKEKGGGKGTNFFITFVAVFLIYLLFTATSGEDLLFWSKEELVAGLVLALVAGAFGAKFLFFDAKDLRMVNPKRYIYFLLYLGPFFLAMAKANIDVAYRVITGKINPGIVRIRTGLKTDLAVTLLANSITLTPGTLTVDLDEKTNDLYIHWINVDESALHREENECDIKAVCGSFPDWARRIAE
ncbi:MAG TPA: cation:proton antiporter [Thermoplasmata archaeon]|nr:cation:proton antiporter [Thermoplasmata archaeon]